MTEIVKGSYVHVTARTRAVWLGSGEFVWINPEEEFKVSSITKDFYRIRRTKRYSNRDVIEVERSLVERMRDIGEVPEGAIGADDPRVAWIFEDSIRIADQFGYCGYFDRIVNIAGFPGRSRVFTVPMLAAGGITIQAKVTARSKSEAEAMVRGKFSAEQKAVES